MRDEQQADREREMHQEDEFDKLAAEIAEIIAEQFYQAGNWQTMPPPKQVRAAILERVPGATEMMIRDGYRLFSKQFSLELDAVTLETGIPLERNTPIGDYLDQAAAAGNERAARMLARMRKQKCSRCGCEIRGE
jgi:hypothetical protein